MDELLDLVGSDILARPRFLPAGLGRRLGLGGSFGALLLVLGMEDILEERHVGYGGVRGGSRGSSLPPVRVTQLRSGVDARRGGSAMQGRVLFNCFFLRIGL